jgi:small GTP-binding protein
VRNKINFVQLFIHAEFIPSVKTTITTGFAHKTIQTSGKIVRTQSLDTAGQERFRAVNASFYQGALGALLFYDITYYVSFRNAEVWLKELRTQTGDIPVILVGNKCDLTERRAVPVES